MWAFHSATAPAKANHADHGPNPDIQARIGSIIVHTYVISLLGGRKLV